MKTLFNNIFNGATTQFGREFGRAGANVILKGKNSYQISNVKNDRILPSDSKIVRNIKEINRIEFVKTNKSNVIRLKELNDFIKPHLKFNGWNIINNLDNIREIIDLYISKYNFGVLLIDKDYNEDEFLFVIKEHDEILEQINKLNNEIINFIDNEINKEKNNKKDISKARKIHIFSLGLLTQFYLSSFFNGLFYLVGMVFFYSLFFLFKPLIVIPILILIYGIFSFRENNVNNFDNEYNERYVWLVSFKNNHQKL
jgi:hypothetical protein